MLLRLVEYVLVEHELLVVRDLAEEEVEEEGGRLVEREDGLEVGEFVIPAGESGDVVDVLDGLAEGDCGLGEVGSH